MENIKKVDFSKFAEKATNATKVSSKDTQMIFMAKTVIAMLNTKMKVGIGVAVYFILSGIIFNLYLIYKLLTYLL